MTRGARYAEGTRVPVSRSRDELEGLLERYGATGFAYFRRGDAEIVAFEVGRHQVRLDVPMPPRDAKEFRHHPGGRARTAAQVTDAYAAEQRRRWRVLVMVVKAKLECIASGVSTIEREFLADVVLHDGQTVGQWMAPQLEGSYRERGMPALLPGTGNR